MRIFTCCSSFCGRMRNVKIAQSGPFNYWKEYLQGVKMCCQLLA